MPSAQPVACSRSGMRACARACARACMGASVRAMARVGVCARPYVFTRLRLCVCICKCKCAYMRACVRAWVHDCVCVCVCVCVSARASAFLYVLVCALERGRKPLFACSCALAGARLQEHLRTRAVARTSLSLKGALSVAGIGGCGTPAKSEFHTLGV